MTLLNNQNNFLIIVIPLQEPHINVVTRRNALFFTLGAGWYLAQTLMFDGKIISTVIFFEPPI